MTDAPQFPRPHLTARNAPDTASRPVALVAVLFAVVMAIIVGWLLFAELTRCDPCEWVGLEAPLIGDW